MAARHAVDERPPAPTAEVASSKTATLPLTLSAVTA
jgi:hypothetical protein